ncbi:MAG TPA: DUF1015 domain-containing protein [Actinomycetota bacterium]|nr:DUF1015 domain-containing protein [Actinomycetota bacterium]
MPELRPFRGIRYSSREELADLVCPPYDVIGAEEQQALHGRHENNAIRLELAEPRPDQPNKYAHVGETLESWLEQGVLVPEDQPALYVYRQDFVGPDGGRRRVVGVIGALTLEKFGTTTGVLPHERTMPGPKEDRLALMRACKANISPIYAIYRGGGGVRPFLDSLEDRRPDARFADTAETLQRLWVITAPAEIATLTDAIAPGPLVIADGHHRYETALAYHQENKEQSGDHDSIMCFCVDADSEELVVLPYHRALRAEAPGALDGIKESFGGRDLDEEPADALARSGSDHPLAVVMGKARLLAEVSDEQVIAAVGERHPAWRSLDVVALHEVVIPQVFGEPEELRFSRESAEMIRLVESDGWTAAFLLRALSAAQVVDVASSGERMPQKASYFWPKALTGLVFHSLR